MSSVAICALAVAIVGSSSSVIAGQSTAAARHAPIEVLRDATGKPVQTFNGQLVSSNWSGYALAEFQTKHSYTAAQATWIVPEVFFDGLVSVSSSWIGIGGFCKSKNCSQVDHTLIQLGTEQDALDETPDYYAWYELIPGAEIPTTLDVQPGDVITASLSCAGKCSSKQLWTLSMIDETTGQSWGTVVNYQSSKLSVEAIEEAPSDQFGTLPLADFGTATFGNTMVDGAAADLSKGDSLIMQDNDGSSRRCSKSPHCQTSNVSVLNSSLDGFNACFSPDSTLATCPSP